MTFVDEERRWPGRALNALHWQIAVRSPAPSDKQDLASRETGAAVHADSVVQQGGDFGFVCMVRSGQSAPGIDRRGTNIVPQSRGRCGRHCGVTRPWSEQGTFRYPGSRNQTGPGTSQVPAGLAKPRTGALPCFIQYTRPRANALADRSA